jgi:hypothetical protein
MQQDGDARELWNHVPEELEPLTGELGRDLRQPGDVAAGMREACDKPARDRIANGYHDDRDRPGRVLCRFRIGGDGGRDDVDLASHQVCREVGEPLAPAVRIMVLDADVLALDR